MAHLRESLTAQAGLLAELVTEVVGPTLQRSGISLSTFELLSAVRSGGGALTQAELARRMGISAPTLCEAVQHATKRGLIRQNRHALDGRAKVLALSDDGAKVVNEILERMNRAERLMVEGIQDQDLSIALNVLKHANRNLAEVLNPQA